MSKYKFLSFLGLSLLALATSGCGQAAVSFPPMDLLYAGDPRANGISTPIDGNWLRTRSTISCAQGNPKPEVDSSILYVDGIINYLRFYSGGQNYYYRIQISFIQPGVASIMPIGEVTCAQSGMPCKGAVPALSVRPMEIRYTLLSQDSLQIDMSSDPMCNNSPSRSTFKHTSVSANY